MDNPAPAVANLTDKEREALRLWLGHATAKEIALDLGVSHHAVEKRLKSARQKLGVQTSLDAARILAEAERYGRTASQPPEVDRAAAGAQVREAREAVELQSRPFHRHPVMIGVIFMSLTMLAALALTASSSQDAPAPAIEAQLPEVVFIDKRDGAIAGADAAFDKLFARLDKDSSGFLEGAELNRSQLRMVKAAGSDTAAQPEQMELSAFDSDGDGRVSPAEYRAGMAALLERGRT